MRHCILWLGIAIAACGPSGRNNDDTGDDDDTPDGGPVVTPDARRCEKIDVLFVIDNSGSMGQEQANLTANFPMFIQVLNDSGLDYRVGVTTTGRNYTYQMMTPIGPITESQDGGDNGRLFAPGVVRHGAAVDREGRSGSGRHVLVRGHGRYRRPERRDAAVGDAGRVRGADRGRDQRGV